MYKKTSAVFLSLNSTKTKRSSPYSHYFLKRQMYQISIGQFSQDTNQTEQSIMHNRTKALNTSNYLKNHLIIFHSGQTTTFYPC